MPCRTVRSDGLSWRGEAIAFLLSGLLCCAALIWLLQLWRADLRVPIHYGYSGDVTFECMLAKDIADSGWLLHNPRLGAPGGQDLRDFPMPDLVTFLSMKVISWFTSSWGAIVNLYFFAGFLLATWSALAVLRHFGIARAPAVLAALLFALAPYHFFRGEWHLHLSAYFVIPLAAMLALWCMAGERLFTIERRSRFLIFPVPSKKGWVAIAACAMLGSDGAYYAFFTILLLMCAGLYRAFEGRGSHRVAVAGGLVGLIVLALVLNLLPNVLHILAVGKNPEVAVRAPAAAELYALKLTQLVLPISGHRIPALAEFKAAYNRSQPEAINGAEAAALGAFGAAGFCFLMISLLVGYPWEKYRELIRQLSRLNLCAFLIGTLGGVGSLLAWTVWSQIRAYNRISIFIAFFSVMALAALLDEIWRRWVSRVVPSLAFSGVLAAILVAGLLDQTSGAMVPPYENFRGQYRSDAEFARQAERQLPHGAMVLQLPFMPFPEVKPPGSMRDYDPLLPYLHSKTLRWSYGAVKGRYWGIWQAHLASRPIEDVLEAAAAAGFAGIYIDRDGYADKGASIGTRLTALGLAHIEAPNGRFWLYDIQPYAVRMQSQLTPANWVNMRDAVLHPLVVQWLPPCSGLEQDARKNWHWCGSTGDLLFENPTPRVQRIEVHGAAMAGMPGACTLHIDGPNWTETLPLTGDRPHPFAHILESSPGRTMIRLQSDCPHLPAATDLRPLVFHIDNFSAVLMDTAPEPELVWSGGFYGLERDGARTSHWCSSSGELTIRNPGPASETVIRMTVASGPANPAPLSIAGPGFAESLTARPTGTVFSKRFLIPQGDSVVRFTSPAAPLIAPHDPRKLVFRVDDLTLGNSLLAPTVIYK